MLKGKLCRCPMMGISEQPWRSSVSHQGFGSVQRLQGHRNRFLPKNPHKSRDIFVTVTHASYASGGYGPVGGDAR